MSELSNPPGPSIAFKIHHIYTKLRIESWDCHGQVAHVTPVATLMYLSRLSFDKTSKTCKR